MVNFVGVERGVSAVLCRWLVLLASLLVGGVTALAQDEDPPETRPPETLSPPDVFKDGTLDLTGRIYILDSRNKPVFVPTTYEQYLDRAADAARRAEGGDAPPFAFDEFLVQARVVGKVAEVDARIKVTLNDLARKNTDIPLRLQSCMLTEKATFEGNGKSQIQVGRSGQPGYTWSLQADAATTHTTKLAGQSVVQTDGDRQSLLVALPAALCTVQVSLPANIQDIVVRGQGGELTSDEPIDEGRRVTIKSQGGDLNISWRTGGDSKPAAGAAEAISITRLRIDDPSEPWSAETLISLRSHGESTIETLVVELPEGSEWLPADKLSGDPYSVLVDETNSRKLTIRAAARVNLVTQSMQIRYRWQAPVQSGESSWNNLSVPNVIIRGVDRHEGSLTMSLPASLGLEWKSPPGVALVGQTRVGEIRQSFQYQFQFVRQPLGLNVSFRREVNLPEVRPTYLVDVDRNGITLTGWLKCAFDRAHEPELGIDMGEWELESAQIIADITNPMAEGELLDQQIIEEGAQRVLKLRSQLDPELAGAALREQQVWRITAFRKHSNAPVDRLALTVPSILLLASDKTRVPLEHASGLLLIVSSENVMLEYDGQSSRSLLTDAIAEPWQTLLAHVPEDRVLSYRFQAGAQDKPVWSGRLEILPRRIAAEQSVQLKLDPEIASVHQRFQLQIANESLNQLQLATNGAQDISVLVDGIPWVLESLPAESTTAENTSSENTSSESTSSESTSSERKTELPSSTKGLGRLIAKGGRKLIGKVLIEVRSQHALPRISEIQNLQGESRSEAIAANIPLVSLAVEDVLIRSPITVLPSIDRRLQVSLGSRDALAVNETVEDAGDEVASKATWTDLNEDVFEIPAAQIFIPLKMVQLAGADPLPVRVSGAWLQTVISGSTRADRFCARFKTAQELIRVRLPANDLLAQVAIDGVEQVFIAPRDGLVEISLREASQTEEHTLEVWTRSNATAGWFYKIDVIPIEIEGCSRFDHFYWQLVTGPNMHLALLPEHLTPEWSWQWDRLWWRRNSPMDQADLEQWLSASSQRPLAQTTNKYVVSGYGAMAGFQVWTVSRLLLWLPIGLIAIGGALLVSLFRSFRHPAALLLLIACVLSMATIWPDLAILLGQTSLVALVIVLLYALTQAAIESRVRRRSVFTSRPTSGAYDASDNQSLVRPTSVESDVMPTTHTQSPVVTDGGGS